MMFTQSAQTEYYLTDHLGSIRTTIDQNGTVIGFDDYDPFGNILPGRSLNLGTPNDLNKFTGHERDQEGGLDLDYMLARNYDSELGRFYSVDPFYNKFPAWSPYNYTMNNPLRFIDPDGRDLVEKIKNLFAGKSWRDDTIHENFAQKDWKNATPQIAELAGVDLEKTVVKYDDKDSESRFVTRGNEISTTKKGFEDLNENNIDNSVNSMVHEKQHADDNINGIKVEGRDKLEKSAKKELKAIDSQRAHSSWKKTTKTFKANTQQYENKQSRTLRNVERRYENK